MAMTEAKRSKRVTSINDYELPRKRTRSQRTPTPRPEIAVDHDKDEILPNGNPTHAASALASSSLRPDPRRNLRSNATAKFLPATSLGLEIDFVAPDSKAAIKAAKMPPKKIVGSEKVLTEVSSAVSKADHSTISKKIETKTAPRKKLPTAHTHPVAALSSSASSSSGLPVTDKSVLLRRKAFAQKEQRFARGGEGKDFLIQLPAPGTSYVTKKGEFTINDGRFDFPPPPPEHPKILEARKNDTITREKHRWYQGMPRNVTIPTAGISLEKPSYTLHDDSEDAFHARPSIKLFVPDILKAMLVDDWENITKNNQLVPLPHPHPVTKILEDYAAYEIPKRPAGSSHVDILEETLAGLKEYFDKSLGRILLYRFERAQYAEMYKMWMSEDPEYQGKTASDTYGPEHLMRLIVSLPELVAQTNMDQQSVNRLREELVKFCTWLSKNTTEYFVSHYESPPQDYIQKAKD
ncbi:MRG-domain-containing protein [Daldinia sp. FL1419]|nr:MRG-domain-containing protein [Daldinia sp. FL1419]